MKREHGGKGDMWSGFQSLKVEGWLSVFETF